MSEVNSSATSFHMIPEKYAEIIRSTKSIANPQLIIDREEPQ